MTQSAEVTNPRARLTGVIYLLYFLTAIFAAFLNSRKLVVYSNAVNLFAYVCYAIVTLLFYYLFKPVHRPISFIAMLFSLLGCAIGVLYIFHIGPYHINQLVFFGPYCLAIGYLIFRSMFLPRSLGILMMLAGLGWLVFLLPHPTYLSYCIEAIGILAEALLMLWLIVKGVNIQRWQEQAG